MRPFNPDQKEFLEEMMHQEKEDDWIRIPGHVLLVEEKEKGKIIGLAGITLRYHIIPSLFIAVSPTQRGKGIASRLMERLMKKWKGPLFLTYYQKKAFLGNFYGKYGFKKIISWRGGRVLCVRL